MNRANESTTAVLGCIGTLALLPLLMAYGVLLNAYAVMKLWAWFVVPAFGLSALTLPAAAGLRLVFGVFRGYIPEPEKKDASGWERVGKSLIEQTVFIGLALLFGYVIKTWWLA